MVAGLAVLALLSLVGLADAGARGLLPTAALVALALLFARDVLVARETVWRAARLPLDDPRQRPVRVVGDRFWAPTAVALQRLAASIDSARRGRFAEASDILALIDPVLLRADETRLAHAARAMVSLGLGEKNRAAQQAALAVPSGSDELDASLGRVMLSAAWDQRERLLAIENAWEAAGIGTVGDHALERLRRLLRVRLDERRIAELGHDEATELREEAEAVGDTTLAAELVLRSRSGTYR